MEPIALTRASQLIHITDTLERLGESAEAMLGQAKLPMWHFCDPDDLIPAHHIYVLMEHAARTLGNSTFGLLVGTDSSRIILGFMIATALMSMWIRLCRSHFSWALHCSSGSFFSYPSMG